VSLRKAAKHSSEGVLQSGGTCIFQFNGFVLQNSSKVINKSKAILILLLLETYM
jgi:hypothetical protein